MKIISVGVVYYIYLLSMTPTLPTSNRTYTSFLQIGISVINVTTLVTRVCVFLKHGRTAADSPGFRVCTVPLSFCSSRFCPFFSSKLIPYICRIQRVLHSILTARILLNLREAACRDRGVRTLTTSNTAEETSLEANGSCQRGSWTALSSVINGVDIWFEEPEATKSTRAVDNSNV